MSKTNKLASSHKQKNIATPNATDTKNAVSVTSIPVVGIGCSAGGLEALQKFFSHAPVDSGLVFVVVQHLAPTYVG
jgi:two-component system CheB/CheR fusion protein